MLTLLEKQDIKNILAHLKVSYDDETNTCNKIFLKQKFETLDKESWYKILESTKLPQISKWLIPT